MEFLMILIFCRDLKATKIRRLKAQPQDLLFGNHSNEDALTRSYNHPLDNTATAKALNAICRVPSAPGSLK